MSEGPASTTPASLYSPVHKAQYVLLCLFVLVGCVWRARAGRCCISKVTSEVLRLPFLT